MKPSPTVRTLLGVALGVALSAGLLIAARPATATATAQSASASAVAVVDLNALLEGLDERKFLEDQLNTAISRRQAQLDEILTQLNKKNEDKELQAAGTPERRETLREIRELEIAARARREFLQQEISLEKGDMLLDLFGKVRSAADEIAQRDGWDVVLIDDGTLPLPERGTEQQALALILSRRILHKSDRVDITDEVRIVMNNRFNAGAKAP